MRNLKRALSLGLTAAMISGLMVMGSSAASYADVTSENNVEAIEVLESVGIMIGDESGNFNPDQNVTRNEMAVVMANLMEYNVATYKDTSPFTDVPSWAEPYVAACWTNGITAGYSDTIYGGSDTVTTAQAALMLMKALGYFQYSSDFGGDWQLATVRQGNAIDLFVGVDSGVTQAMTRNDVAQLVLNTLESGTVEASTDGSWTIGNVTINNNVKYNYITSNADYAQAINTVTSTDANTDAGQSIIELGEQLYMGDLELKNNDTDMFGRPARTWEYDSQKIGTYAKTELLREEYTTKVTGKNLYDLLGSNVINNYTFYISVDGETERDILGDAYFTEAQMIRSNDDALGETGNGVLTQVYVNNIDKQVHIAVINTYLAIAAEDYDEKNDELDLDVYKIDDLVATDHYVKTSTEATGPSDFTVSGEDFDIENVAEDDRYLVTVADGEIQTMEAPEILAGSTVSSFRIDKYVVSEGTQYDFASTAEYDVETLENWTGWADTSNLKDLTYDIILDQYGYAIGVKLVEDPDQYVFLTGLDQKYSYLGSRNADANVIFTDGTMDTITVNLRDSRGLKTNDDPATSYNDIGMPDGKGTLLNGVAKNGYGQINTWCTYTVDNNGVYTLRRVAENTVNDPKAMQAAEDVGTSTVEINKGNVALNGVGNGSGLFGRVYGNDETVYLNVDNVTDLLKIEDDDTNKMLIIDDVDSVTVGAQNASIKVTDVANSDGYAAPKNEIYTLHDDDGYIIAVVTIGEDQGSTTNYAYITGGVNRESYGVDGDQWSWTVPAIVNGKAVELREVGDSLTELYNLTVGGWYEVRYDADGNVRRVSSQITFPTTYTSGDEFIGDVDNIQTAINDKSEDTLLYWQDFCNLDGTANNLTNLSFKGNTLFIDTLGSASRGFSVSPDVNVALALADKDHDPFDDVDDSYTGTSGLEKALRNLDTTAVDVDNDGMLDYTLNGHLSFVMEDGVITSIVLNDYTGPRNNTVSAATPNVKVVTTSPVSATVGQSVTLTVAVDPSLDNRDYGTLSYQWYKENGTTDIAVGTNSASYTYTPAAAGSETYYCVVTNYDNGRDITGAVRTSATSSNIVVNVGAQSMNVVVWLSTDGTTKIPGVAPIMVPVTAMPGNAYTAMLDVSAITLPDGYMLNDVDHYLTFKANTTVEELVEVYETVDVKLPDEVSATWSYNGATGTVTDGVAPKGATVTLALDAGIGSYDASGTSFNPNRTASSDIEVLASEFGYFQVNVTGDYINNTTVYLKPGEARNVTFSGSGNWAGNADVAEPTGWTFVKDTTNSTSGSLVGSLTGDNTVLTGSSPISVTLDWDGNS